MAAKRAATTQLNIYNLEDDDEPEQPEQPEEFKRADENVLKSRVIKVAKRRNPIGSLAMNESDKKNAFNNFTFGKTNTGTSNSFSFLKNINKQDEKQKESDSMGHSEQITSKNNSDEYHAKLKGLNESVTKWIKQHVDVNPFLNLTPIFKDYERYLEEIEKLKPDGNESQTTLQSKNVEENVKLSEKTKSDLSAFSFKNTPTTFKSDLKNANGSPRNQSSVENSKSITTTTADKTSGFAFGFPTAQNASCSTTATSSQAFSFGSSKTESTPSVSYGVPKSSSSSGFSFTNSVPFTFTNVQTLKTPNTTTNTVKDVADGEEETDEPPKNDFKPVIEEGHVYSIRCKVFVKKGEAYADRGIGNLFLKPIEGSEKTQLVVRADTNLGNVLLNFILSESIPLQRIGKKDVMVVVLPTPDFKPPPVPVLLRVKSPDEADNLLKQLEKYKK